MIYQTNSDQNIKCKLTHSHHTDEQADYYPEHPEKPLRGKSRSEILGSLLNLDGQGLHQDAGARCTHCFAPYSRQDEQQADGQHQEDQDDGEQAAAEDEGGPL